MVWVPLGGAFIAALSLLPRQAQPAEGHSHRFWGHTAGGGAPRAARGQTSSRTGESSSSLRHGSRDGAVAPSVRPERQTRDEDGLIARYLETRDPALQEQIVVACTPLVRRIVSDFIFSGVPTDDLMQVGFIGLLNAVELFDPTRGVKFVTYASHLIRGEIRHHLRDHRDTIRKPRWLQKRNAQSEEAG